jgi:translation initiation factor IF-2
MSTDEIIVDIVHSAVGAVTETDVLLASTAGAIVIAFHIAPDNKARKLAEREGVEIRRHEVIYDLTDEVQQALEGMLEPDTVEEVIGLAEVLDIFSSSRWGSIAGCRIVQGLAKKSCEGRLLRDGKVIHQAPLSSLRHFKDDVREVKEGKECGIKLENFEDIQVGDTIEMIEKVQKARTLEDAQTVSSTEKAT